MQSNTKASTLYVALVAGMGMFLSTLDAGIINIAIPSFIKIFHTTLDMVIWTITLYTLILSATIMLFGKLADRYGRLRIYVIGLIIFGVSSFLCGSSPNIQMLIVSRALQGLSAAMLQATTIAVITTSLEKEEINKAISILVLLMGLGPALGPALGGFILSTIGWQWIFWINIPICLITVMGCKKLQVTNEELHKENLNYFNLILFGTSILFLLLGMNYLATNLLISLVFFLIMIVMFSLTITIDLKSPYPIINYHLFKDIRFTAPMLGIIANGGATAIVFILPPLFFEQLRQYTAWQVGLVSLSAPIGMIISSQLFKRIPDLFGTAIPMISGLLLITVSLITLTLISTDWSTSFIFFLLFLYGFGNGIFMPATLIHLTSQFVLQKQAYISAFIRMIQNAAVAFGAAGSAMLISLKSAQFNLIIGIQHGWLLAAILSLTALIALAIMFLKSRELNNLSQ